MKARPSAGLWGHADFMRLWSAQAISSFGARIAREGLPMAAVISLRADPASMGVLAAFGLGAYGLVGLLAGSFADRLPKRPLMIAADVGRALTMIAVPVAALFRVLTLVDIYLAMALMSALTVIFDVADHAFLPQLIEPGDLVDGNAKLATTDAVAEVAGPAVGGALFQLVTAPLAVGLTAVTYMASALCLLAIPPRAAPAASEPAKAKAFDLTLGVRTVWSHPLARPLWLMAVVRDFFGWFFGALYVLYALNVLKLSPGMLGLTIAGGGVGGVVGAALAPAITRRLGAGRTIVLAGLTGALATVLIPLAGGPPLVAMAILTLAQLVGDALQTVSGIGVTSLRQQVLPAAALGSTGGAFAAGQGLAGVMGALAAGALGGAIGPRETLFIAAAGVALAPLFGLVSPLWRSLPAR